MPTREVDHFGKLKWVFVVALAVLIYLNWGGHRPKNIAPPDDPTFQSEVVASTQPVLVKFGADWCGPCRAMDQELAKLPTKTKQSFKIVHIDVDEKSDLSSHYGVSSIPHSFVFYKGKIMDDRIGFMDAAEVETWIDAQASKISKL